MVSRRALSRGEVISIAASLLILLGCLCGLGIVGFGPRTGENGLRVVQDDRRYFDLERYDASTRERDLEWDRSIRSLTVRPNLGPASRRVPG
jgi:hypothetical protein